MFSLSPLRSPQTAVRNRLATVESWVRSFGRDVANRHPAVRDPLFSAWNWYILSYAHTVCWWHSVKFARRTELSPFEIVWVDPDDVEYLVEADGYPKQARPKNEFPGPKFKNAGTVQGGEWDSTDSRFEETDIYRAFEEHFERGVDWSDTEFYDRVVELMDDGVTMWGCSTRQEFERRCAEVDRLYDVIRTEGYHSQRELARTDSEDSISDREESPIVRLVYDELTVCVGREGELLFLDGRNRLAIAKVLDLDAIPVWILVRHEQWQSFRERLAANPSLVDVLPEKLRKHPDVRKIQARRNDRGEGDGPTEAALSID